MSKRARYVGGSPVRVQWPAGEIKPEGDVLVEPNHLLPAEVPAAVRDELLKTEFWSEVEQSAPSKSDKDDTEEKS